QSVFAFDILLPWQLRDLTAAAGVWAHAIGSGGTNKIFFIVGCWLRPGMMARRFWWGSRVVHEVAEIALKLDSASRIIINRMCGNILDRMLVGIIIVEIGLAMLLHLTCASLLLLHICKGIIRERMRGDAKCLCRFPGSGQRWIRRIGLICTGLR